MEQKRTLWIIAAVGLFLLVVLGAALIVYSPAGHKSSTIASSNFSNKDTSSNGWITLKPSNPALPEVDMTSDEENASTETQSVSEMTIFAENATIYSDNTSIPSDSATTIDLNIYPTEAVAKETTVEKTEVPAPKADTKKTSEKPAATTASKTPVIDQKLLASAKTETPSSSVKTETKTVSSTTASKTESKTPAVTVKPASTTVASSTKTSSKTSSKTTAKTDTKTVASSTAKVQPQKMVYWIQVSALKSRKSADEARATLGENQITADVFTYKDNKDQLFYRVRVGPYTTKSEAEYWQSKIATISNFKNSQSYITSTPVENN